jgi:hypothetical protein
VKSFCEAEVSIYTNFRFVILGKGFSMLKILLIASLLTIPAVAVTIAQEFKLPVTFSGTNSDGKFRSSQLVIGYDPNASDSMIDVQWSESEPPPFVQQGDISVRSVNRTIGRTYLSANNDDGGPVDIRRKPSTSSFILQYEIYTSSDVFGAPISVQWDNSLIPPIIKHIILAPEGDPDIKGRLDMVKESQFTITVDIDSINLYNVILISLLYNQEIMAVHQSGPTQQKITIISNPMDDYTQIDYTLTQDSRITLSLYDVTGKKVYERSAAGATGKNSVDLFRHDISGSSGVYFVRLIGTEEGRPFEASTRLIVR